MDNKVEVIKETLGVENNEAKKALDLADQDLDKALEMVEFVDKSYVLIQGKLNYGGYNKNYALFNLILNGKEGEFIKTNSVVDTDNKLWETDLTVNNKVFTKTIDQFSSNLNKKKQHLALKKIFTPAHIYQIFQLTKEDNIEERQFFFAEKLERYLEEAVELEIIAKLKTKVQLTRDHPDLFSNEKEDTKENTKEEGQLGLDIKLKCRPFISPTKGKRPRDLHIEDKLVVEIIDNREIGRYFGKLLTSKSSDLVTGKITALNFNSAVGRYSITVQFGPRVYGKLVTGTEIKIATKNDSNSTPNSTKIEEKDSNNNSIILLVAMSIIILAIVSVGFYLI
ncbi:hypothetical protein Halha_1375 [Halobacteroides halobius DSM 5150]|uniref:Uncharacterized protein n=1 Tax=Halobacteroides halobius (strain ATCC 35273 / DSM 5150 / MD-1) TaxID=748449 RepID=L0K9X7_HALHC|nr:hypothetical protein [Halobacteroides halobius]AGB41320.1 hypothetical protein Halha_1375 [Halobacteroides halobius DSM 5150]